MPAGPIRQRCAHRPSSSRPYGGSSVGPVPAIESWRNARGEALPRSTLTAALSRDSLPREDLVAAFVRTWGDDEDQVRRWIDARRRIAAATGWQEPEPGGDTPGEDVAGNTVAGGEKPGVGTVVGTVLADWLPPAIRRGSWPVRILASAVVAVVAVTVFAATVRTVRDLTGPDRSDRTSPNPTLDSSAPSASASPPSQSSTPAPASSGQGSEWVDVRTGKDVILADEQAIDFDTGIVGDRADRNPGFDIALSHRGDRLTAAAPPSAAGIALLDTQGEQSAHHCMAIPPQQWEDIIGDIHRLRAGTNICVATGEHRSVMITIDRAPDNVVTVLTFHYTVWERS